LSFESVINEKSVVFNSYPDTIPLGDMNNANWIDLIVINTGTNNIGVVLGYDNATFASQKIYSIGDDSRLLSVTLGDFTNDTYLDIALTNYDTHDIEIHFGY